MSALAPLRDPPTHQVAARPGTLVCLGLVLAAYAVFCVTYLPINAFTEGRRTHVLFLPGEEALPLIPAFEFAYVLTYVLPFVIVWCRPSRVMLLRLVLAFALTLATAYATYLAFPVFFQRPVLTGDSLAIRLLALEYLDKPYNHFPSLHVAISILVALGCAEDRLLRRVLPPLVVLISVSTVFVKQHYVVDVIAAAAVAWGAWWLAARWAR